MALAINFANGRSKRQICPSGPGGRGCRENFFDSVFEKVKKDEEDRKKCLRACFVYNERSLCRRECADLNSVEAQLFIRSQQ